MITANPLNCVHKTMALSGMLKWLVVKLNENEAVRDGRTVLSVDCTIV